MKKRTNHFMETATIAVSQKYHEQRAQRIMDTAWKRFEELLEQNEGETKQKRMHTERSIYPAIALFFAIAEETGSREEARGLIYDFYTEQSERKGKTHRRLLSVPGLYKCVPGVFANTIKKSFNEQAGFEYKFLDQSKGCCRFDMLRCPYVEACQKYGCPELASAFCDSDDGSFGNLHPRLEWKRTKTLGKGGDRCDFSIKIR